jgi:hypothetical protein
MCSLIFPINEQCIQFLPVYKGQLFISEMVPYKVGFFWQPLQYLVYGIGPYENE